jgi:hypothetical protein
VIPVVEATPRKLRLKYCFQPVSRAETEGVTEVETETEDGLNIRFLAATTGETAKTKRTRIKTKLTILLIGTIIA